MTVTDDTTAELPADPGRTAAQPAADRRVRRSRRALHIALVTLSTEKGYDSLTVDDLTTHADMARRTFYAHFVDKDDLLRSVVSELVLDLAERLRELMTPELRLADEATIRVMFAHGQKHLPAYRMVLAGAGNGIGLRMLANTLSDTVEAAYTAQCEALGVQPRLPYDFLARVFVGQHLTLLRWWLDNQSDYSLEQMAAMRAEVFLHGEARGLGFDVGSVPSTATSPG